MKKPIFCLITLCMMFAMFTPQGVYAQGSSQKQLLSPNAMSENEPLLRHVVLFSFKEDASEKDINKIVEAFSALPDKIPQIKGYEWGTNNSPEGLNEGLTHCFLVTFTSEEDRAVYLPHPAHKAFVKILSPVLEKAVVVDYWSNEK